MERLTPHNALKQLSRMTGKEFIPIFHHGTLQVEIYKPNLGDHQQPHTRDEIYVVIAGSGVFVNGTDRHPFESGEVLFVPAGREHRFEHFTDDFSTWVFFYGPEGGER